MGSVYLVNQLTLLLNKCRFITLIQNYYNILKTVFVRKTGILFSAVHDSDNGIWSKKWQKSRTLSVSLGSKDQNFRKLELKLSFCGKPKGEKNRGDGSNVTKDSFPNPDGRGRFSLKTHFGILKLRRLTLSKISFWFMAKTFSSSI